MSIVALAVWDWLDRDVTLVLAGLSLLNSGKLLGIVDLAERKLLENVSLRGNEPEKCGNEPLAKLAELAKVVESIA